jgi:hypothetical protein
MTIVLGLQLARAVGNGIKVSNEGRKTPHTEKLELFIEILIEKAGS